MPNAYPIEFRRDVVQVARNRPPGVSLEKIAADFGIHPITLSTWLKKAGIDDGVKPGITSAESAEPASVPNVPPIEIVPAYYAETDPVLETVGHGNT